MSSSRAWIKWGRDAGTPPQFNKAQPVEVMYSDNLVGHTKTISDYYWGECTGITRAGNIYAYRPVGDIIPVE